MKNLRLEGKRLVTVAGYNQEYAIVCMLNTISMFTSFINLK